jgi:hypothetical protein
MVHTTKIGSPFAQRLWLAWVMGKATRREEGGVALYRWKGKDFAVMLGRAYE